ncbi:helix-turn-helix domain-containing protein [Lachnospiraceae bacterium 42-17]|nr:helix-turn-helix domain-containing protein [Oscillospiraceae bacterium]
MTESTLNIRRNKTALTVNEASEYTGIGRNNLRKLIAWEKIPVIRIGNKTLVRMEVLDRFLQENEGHNLKNRYEVIAV